MSQEVTGWVTLKCSACGDPVDVPMVGVRNPKPNTRVPLCERAECISAREVRREEARQRAFTEVKEAVRRIGPQERPEPITVEVETSSGTQKVESEPDSDVDTLVERFEEEKVKKKEKALETQQKTRRGKKRKRTEIPAVAVRPVDSQLRERQEQPGYLKSVPIPVIPDPKAPYGRDKDGKPLVPMRPDQQRAIDLSKKPELAPGECPHKNDPNNCVICGTKETAPVPESVKVNSAELTQVQRVMNACFEYSRKTGRPIPLPWLEQRMRKEGLSVPKADNKTKSHREQKDTKLNCRQILQMSCEDILALFDKPIRAERFVTEQVLMNEAEKVRLENFVVPELQEHIKETEAILKTRSVAWLKRHQPDDIYPKETRERLKYEDKKTLAALTAELRGYRERLKNWETDPRNRVPVRRLQPASVTFGEKYPVKCKASIRTVEYVPDQLRTPKDGVPYWTEIMTNVWTLVGDEYTVKDYSALLQNNAVLLGDRTWDGWRDWENRVLLLAMKCKLIKPTESQRRQLSRWVVVVDDNDDDHEAEIILIKKTAGGALGIGFDIYSRGKRDGKQRPLEDFGETMTYSQTGGDEPGSNYVPDISNETESFDPN